MISAPAAGAAYRQAVAPRPDVQDVLRENRQQRRRRRKERREEIEQHRRSDERRPEHESQAFERGVQRHVVARSAFRRLAIAHVPHAEKRGDHAPEGKGVAHVGPSQAGRRDHDAAERRAGDRRHLEHGGVEADRIRQMLAGHQHRQQRVPRRQVERGHGGTEGRQHVDRPHARQPAECQVRERQRDKGGPGLRDQHQSSPVPRIGDDAAEHRKDDDRHHPDETDEAQGQTLLIRRDEQRYLPQQRCVLHRRPGEREEQTDPDQPEVPMLKGDEGATRKYQVTRTILPMCWLDSSRRCASAADRRGNVA